MKKHKSIMVALALSLLLGGCGTPMHEITAEEEELIVHYAAYILAKHNIQQKDGMSGIYIPDDFDNTQKPQQEETESTEPETEVEPEGDAQSTEEEQVPVEQGVSLATVIGHEELQVVYEGSYLADNYIEGEAYSVDATPGNTFYVMKIKISNTTDKDVEVDNASVNLIFKLVSGDLKVKSEVTFLATDFSTYRGSIKAGETVETILLFEVPKSNAETITDPTLQITLENEIKNIQL